MNNSREKATCIQYKLSNANICDNCIKWQQYSLLNPKKKRRSKCHQPWKLREGGKIATSQVQTLKMLVGSWKDMIQTSVFRLNEIPPEILEAAKLISFEFVPPDPPIHDDQQSRKPCISDTINSPRSRQRSTSRRRSIQRETPNDKFHKYRRHSSDLVTTKSRTRKESNEKLPSPFKPKILSNMMNTIESTFGPALNLLGSSAKRTADTNFSARSVEDKDEEEVEGTMKTLSEEQEEASATISSQPCPPVVTTMDNLHRLTSHATSRTPSFLKFQQQITTLNEKNKDLQGQLDNLRNSNVAIMELESEIELLKNENKKLNETVKMLDLRLEMEKKERGVSNYQQTVNKSYLSKLEEFKDVVGRLMDQLKAKKYVGKEKLGRRMLGEILATHPSISFVSAAEIISISRAQLLTEAKMVDNQKIKYSEIGLSSPSDALLRAILDETTADVLFLIYFRIFHEDKVGGELPSLFLSCDKATNGGFVKIISWYSSTTNRVEQNILDVDKTYGESRDCAMAM